MNFENSSRYHLVCRQCGSGLSRMKRPLWMRLIPGSKRHECDYCAAAYMQVIGAMFNIRRGTGRKRVWKY